MYKLLILCCITTTTLASHVTLLSPELHLLKQAKLIEALPPQKKIKLMVQLKLRHIPQLKQLAQTIYDPNHPNYQKFLTKEHYEQEFASTKASENTVADFFTAQGLTTEIKDHLIYITGQVAQIEQALKVKLNYYQYQNQKIYANAEPVQINGKVGRHIAEIFGLNTLPSFHENIGQAPQTLNFMWENFKPQALPTTTSINGFKGNQLQQTYEIQNIPTINGNVINGKGQTLVIVDKCGSNTKDQIINNANTYFSDNGITPFVNSGPNRNFSIIFENDCSSESTYSREIDLDVQASHTLAPGDNTVLVLGTAQKETLITVINTLRSQNFTIDGFTNAYVISNSWSSPETYDENLETNLLVAAASGISVNFSSGDCGDNSYTDNGKCKQTSGFPIVNYPSSSSYVTAIGASAVFVDADYNYAFETVWGSIYNDNTNSKYNFGGGTGGGISKYYGSVSWQEKIKSYSAGGYGLIQNHGYRRALPDIAMLGDPQTGLMIYTQETPPGAFVKDGGTSLACPLFAATLTLVNQARALMNKGTPIGQAAPYLYQFNQNLQIQKALKVIMPPTKIINSATSPPVSSINGVPLPPSAFTVSSATFGWDSSLTLEPESQFWNDATGVGSPYLPKFVIEMAKM